MEGDKPKVGDRVLIKIGSGTRVAEVTKVTSAVVVTTREYNKAREEWVERKRPLAVFHDVTLATTEDALTEQAPQPVHMRVRTDNETERLSGIAYAKCGRAGAFFSVTNRWRLVTCPECLATKQPTPKRETP